MRCRMRRVGSWGVWGRRVLGRREVAFLARVRLGPGEAVWGKVQGWVEERGPGSVCPEVFLKVLL